MNRIATCPKQRFDRAAFLSRMKTRFELAGRTFVSSSDVFELPPELISKNWEQSKSCLPAKAR
jgi:hypothetical protein